MIPQLLSCCGQLLPGSLQSTNMPWKTALQVSLRCCITEASVYVLAVSFGPQCSFLAGHLIMSRNEFAREVLHVEDPGEGTSSAALSAGHAISDYDLDCLEAAGCILFLKPHNLVVIAQQLLEHVVPVFVCHDPGKLLPHEAGWIPAETVRRRFPGMDHAERLLDFLEELGLCLVDQVTEPRAFFPSLVREELGWWGGSTSHNWLWYCGARVQAKNNIMPPSLLSHLSVTLQHKFDGWDVRISQRARLLSSWHVFLILLGNSSFLSLSFLAVHVRGPHVGDCQVEICVVRNAPDDTGRYLRFLDVAERWKRRPEGAEEWAQAGKLRDEVLHVLENIWRENYGELALETVRLAEFDASSGPRPVARVFPVFVLLATQKEHDSFPLTEWQTLGRWVWRRGASDRAGFFGCFPLELVML